MTDDNISRMERDLEAAELRIEKLTTLLYRIMMYGDWNKLTRPLPGHLRDLYADTMDEYNKELFPGQDISPVYRWWKPGGFYDPNP